MHKLIINAAATAFVLAAFAAPSVASAQDKSADGAPEVKTDGTSTGDSDFEKTRQHMIEMNKESQRTGKM